MRTLAAFKWTHNQLCSLGVPCFHAYLSPSRVLVLIYSSFAARVNMPVQFPSEKVTMGYWAIRGLAAPMRMMAAYAKMDM